MSDRKRKPIAPPDTPMRTLFVLTSPEIPEPVLDMCKAALRMGQPFMLFPKADSYSEIGLPLEFGYALHIAPNRIGQVIVTELYNIDRTEAVQESEPQVLEQSVNAGSTTAWLMEVQERWKNLYARVWDESA